jgi:hypothetical protein
LYLTVAKFYIPAALESVPQNGNRLLVIVLRLLYSKMFGTEDASEPKAFSRLAQQQSNLGRKR